MPRARPIKLELNPVSDGLYLKVEEGPIYFVVRVRQEELLALRDRIDKVLGLQNEG